MGSGKSQSGALGVKYDRQCIVTKLSTGEVLVSRSDFAGAEIHIKNFLLGQGYDKGSNKTKMAGK